MDFRTAEELLALCREEHLPISEVMLRREVALFPSDRETLEDNMAHSWGIMKDAIRQSLEKPKRSMGGLIGGEAAKMEERRRAASPVCGTMAAKAAAYAMGVLEVNASMGLIVAAPTAGSSGVLPGVLRAAQEEFESADSAVVTALWNAAAVGYLITRNATVAGAQGGCQAEVGSAAAMAASAVSELMRGGPETCLAAASMALSGLMGLVCDPVAGLVEAPCQKRNATGAATALVCAEIALSGVTELVPFDEMVEAMYKVGLRMPMELRETSLGGMAVTPTACAVCERVLGEPLN